ncbi:MAG: hypothetical protein KIT25_03760 [Enhydrobacter sp.]|nr:MAG: hypothetical protein KIT25_03760 [Enhydrobacter sp.]
MKFRNLDRFRTGGTNRLMELSIPVPKTPDGRVYRYSPNEQAHPRHFVLGEVVQKIDATSDMKARMRLEPRSNQTVCPYSGIMADDQAFTHPDDIKAAQEIVGHAAVADVEAELQRMFGAFNSNQPRNSLVKITTSVQSRPRIAPRFYRKDLLRELVCDHCGRDYGVYAIGLFCPDCGAPNVRLHFAREVELVETQVALAEAQEEEANELAYRLLGNAHEDVLTSFEATLKAVFLYGCTAATPSIEPPAIRNDFQNVNRGRQQFAKLGFDPFATLTVDDLATLELNIQKRHVIGHNLGIIDAKFAEHSEDARTGETVHLVGEDIREFATLARKVVDGLDLWLGDPSFRPAKPEAIAGVTQSHDDSRSAGTRREQLDAERLGLSPLAFRLGRFLSAKSEKGFIEPIDDEIVLAEFSDLPLPELERAIAELAVDNYISAQALIGTKVPRMGYRLELFATFDPIALNQDPAADAAELARIILEVRPQVSISELHARTGWSLRRFNPALNIVASEIDEGRVLRGYDNNYVVRHFALLPVDEVALNRYVTRMGKASS